MLIFLSCQTSSNATKKSAQVVQGRYPSRLLNARTARPNKEDETNLSPQLLPSTQSYAALELCNGGEDLESIEDLTWKQAASIFCQIVEALALAEEAHQFEVSRQSKKS